MCIRDRLYAAVMIVLICSSDEDTASCVVSAVGGATMTMEEASRDGVAHSRHFAADHSLQLGRKGVYSK